MSSSDTIAARATASGMGGVGIIRISGQLCQPIAKAILGEIPDPRHATFARFVDGENHILDEGLAIFFNKPHSFTGEDVLELHGHGGVFILDLVLQRVIELGARLARPGEFTERAFLNGKMDLTQAEATADVIAAQSQEAARSAMRSLQGVFSRKITTLVEAVTRLRTYVEAAIDFPEEEVDFLSEGRIKEKLEELISQTRTILAEARQGATLKEGMKVVIVGHPNAGKSSLLNALAGIDAAIVSSTAGTTRDVIRETILIDGMPLYLLDTAGLRQTEDAIELEGVNRALNEISNADRILLILDAQEDQFNFENHPLVQQFSDHFDRLIIVKNKIDLTEESAISYQLEKLNLPVIQISAKTALGLPLLKAHLKKCMGYTCENTLFSARSRHLNALIRALQHFQEATAQLTAGELLAEELRNAQQALSEITGIFTADDLLGEIFSSFCIGK